MKKILFALAAVAALASCAKSEVEYTRTGEITFAPVTKSITKSMMTSSAFQTSESFNVWAWHNQVAAGTDVATWNKETDNYYFEEAEFVLRNQSDWGGKTPYYWPKVGSLLFAGYYPTTVKDKASYTFDANTNQMVFADYGQSVVDSEGYTEDLMYFNMTETSHNSGPVPVVFKHALSWVTVNLSRTTDNADSAEYPKITVTDVTFTNVNPKGTGTVTGTDGKIAWTVNGTVADTKVNQADVVLSSAQQKQTEPLFIPQSFTKDDASTADTNEAMELKVTYKISSSATESFTETYTVALAGMSGKEGDQDVTVNAWEPAKHYIYNISIGIEEILITPTVENWTEVTANVATGDTAAGN